MTTWDAIAIVVLSVVAGFETFRAVRAYLNDFITGESER